MSKSPPETEAQAPGPGTTTRAEFPTIDTRTLVQAPDASTARVHPGDGEDAPAADRPPGPRGRIVVREHIATGGMGSVHRAFDQLLGRDLAIKRLSEPVSQGDLLRFVEEAQITGQLDHPNIAPVYDLVTDEHGLPTQLAMKLIEGHTLHELNHRSPPPGAEGRWLQESVRVLIRVCEAVSFAHSRGVIHRDLKPSNVMVGSHGQVYVMDWGIALLREPPVSAAGSPSPPPVRLPSGRSRQEAAGSLCGTPAFMAPEQAHGDIDAIDERTDVYGLGGILHHMLTARAPHDGGDVQTDLSLARRGQVPPLREADDGRAMPPGLCRIVRRALSPDPAERYPTVAAMKADLQAFLRGGGWLAERHFEAGTTIIREGDRADTAYIITDGHCELRKRVDGSERFVRLLGPGEAFGEAAVLGRSVRSATVIASTPVSALVVTREALGREVDQKMWLGAFVEALAERFLEVDRRATRLQAEVERLRGG